MQSFSCTFPATVDSTREARIAATELFSAGSVSEVAADNVLLILSELVTNAVRHAHTPYDVFVIVEGEHVRIEVTDDDPTSPRRRASEPDREDGHGLNLVADLSTSWGVRPRSDGREGKTIWALVDVDPDPPSSIG